MRQGELLIGAGSLSASKSGAGTYGAGSERLSLEQPPGLCGRQRWRRHSSEEILSCWSKRKNQAVAAYERFVLDGIKQGHQEDYYQVKEQRYLGDEEFVDRVERRVERLEPVFPIRMTAQQIVDRISREFGRPAREILGKGRGRIQGELRAIVCYVGREIGGLKLTQAAKVFARDISALSSYIDHGV